MCKKFVIHWLQLQGRQTENPDTLINNKYGKLLLLRLPQQELIGRQLLLGLQRLAQNEDLRKDNVRQTDSARCAADDHYKLCQENAAVEGTVTCRRDYLNILRQVAQK